MEMFGILTLRVGAPDDVLEECVLRRNQSTSSARHFAAYTLRAALPNPRLLLLLLLLLLLSRFAGPGVLPLPVPLSLPLTAGLLDAELL